MRISATYALAVASVMFMAMTVAFVPPASAASGEVRLQASMRSGAASGKADYRERGNHRRLNVEAEDLSATTPAILGVFVNAASQVGTIALAACPTAPTLLCGEMELNTKDGQAVPVLQRGNIISVGTTATTSVLSGTLR